MGVSGGAGLLWCLCPQACVRGWLLRRRFRSLQQEYEEVVREIEGDLSELQWTGRYLLRPVFVPKVCARARGHREGGRVGRGLGSSWGERGLEGGRLGCCLRCAAQELSLSTLRSIST